MSELESEEIILSCRIINNMNIEDVLFTPTEYEVAQILLDLHNLVVDCDSHDLNQNLNQNQPLLWSATRRRSAPDEPPLEAESPSPNLLHNSAPPPPPSPYQNAAETPPTTAATAEAPSLLTTLNVSSSEPEQEPKCSKRTRSLKRNEELLEEIDELTHRIRFLKTELEKSRLYYEMLKTSNIELNAKKQKLSLGVRRENAHLEIGSSNLAVETNSDHQTTSSHRSQMPPVIPDLNETIWTDENNDEAFEAVEKRTTAAEAAAARLRRMQINKMKKSGVPPRL